MLRPENQIAQIRYFTAHVSARPSDPNKPVRQQMYIRALRTLPTISIHYGHFLSHPVEMSVFNPQPGQPKRITVVKTEEKGSDVNLATHILTDGFNNRYDLAVIVSNDSDLLEPMKVVKSQLKKPVGILNPHFRPDEKPSVQLQRYASFFKTVTMDLLRASQFPPTLKDEIGVFHKPGSW